MSTPVIVTDVVRDTDVIVKHVRFTGWNATQQGDRAVRRELRQALKKYGLPLTGPLFDEPTATSGRTTERPCRPASVLLVDIDHFKRVNDSHKHPVGDDVLRSVADVLRAEFRDEQDLLCRFGGEEFAVFPLGLDSTEAPKAADRLRRAVADRVTPADAALVQVTVSVGVAVAHPASDPADVQEILARAELGLYRAENEGRNKVGLVTRPDRRAPALGF